MATATKTKPQAESVVSPMPLTRDDLNRLFPRPSSKARADVWDGYVEALLAEWPSFGAKYQITTPARLGLLLATWGVETGGLQIIWENMSYSASRIMVIFGVGRHSAGVTTSESRRLAHSPRALAERVYGVGNTRKAHELGNRDPGDGYKYRGWGIGQITGRRDHERFVNGEYTYRRAIIAALDEWEHKGCNAWADKARGPRDLEPMKKVRRLINGGLNGWAQFREYAGVSANLWAWDGADPLEDGALAMGERGAPVVDLQRKLTDAGYPLGRIDGTFGGKTEAAVMQFQVSQGLDPTGIATPEVLAALEPDAAAPPPARDIDAPDLAKVSSTWSLGSSLSWLGRLIFGSSALASADAAGGLGVAESAFTQVDRLKSVTGRLGVFGDHLPTILAVVAALVLGYLLMRWGGWLKTERLEKAQSGVDLSH